jgi:hypothetical protein
MGQDDNVVFLTENTHYDKCIAYNYKQKKKSVNQIDYPDLKTAYEDKFPWMKQDSSINETKRLMVCKGNLVIESAHIPLWVALFKKIVFRHIISIDETHDLVFLKTNQGAIHVFRSSDQQFFSFNTETTPAYDAHDVSWLETKIDLETILQPINQSFMGLYFGAYLFKLKHWFFCLKNRFMKTFPNRA